MRDNSPGPRLLVINNMPSFYRTRPFEALIDEFKARTAGEGRVAYQVRRDPSTRAEWFFTADEDLPYDHDFVTPETRSANPFLAHSPRGSVRYLRAYRPTHVFAAGWDTPLSLSAAVYAKLAGSRFVTWVESNDTTTRHTGRVARRYRRAFLRSAQGVVVPTQMSQQYVERMRGRPVRTSLLLNPVDLPRLPDAGAGAGRRMVFVGDFSVRKGFDRFLRAAELGASQGWRAAAWGRDVEGLAAAHPVPNCEIMEATPLDKIIPQLATTDVWLIPSRWDPAPLIYSEALALGLRVVVSDEIGYSAHAGGIEGATFSSGAPAALLEAATALVQGPRPAELESAQVTPEHWASGVVELLLADAVRGGHTRPLRRR